MFLFFFWEYGMKTFLAAIAVFSICLIGMAISADQSTAWSNVSDVDAMSVLGGDTTTPGCPYLYKQVQCGDLAGCTAPGSCFVDTTSSGEGSAYSCSQGNFTCGGAACAVGNPLVCVVGTGGPAEEP